jgi:hypothetical protein
MVRRHARYNGALEISAGFHSTSARSGVAGPRARDDRVARIYRLARGLLWWRSMQMFVKPSLLLAISVTAGCDLGAVSNGGGGGGRTDGGSLPSLPDAGVPVPNDFGVVTAPRTGDTGDPKQEPITIDGYYSKAGEPITIEIYTGGAWMQVATATAATTPGGTNPGTDDGDARYPFEATYDATATWPKGGLLELRARDSAQHTLVSFFHDSDACIGGASSWRARAASCGNDSDRGFVLTSVAGDPDGVFHQQRFLDDKGFVFQQETDAYYSSINAPFTLDGFVRRYIQTDQADAVYFNAGDLGIGREMHCGHFPSANGQGVGCAVSNYGQFDGFESDALFDTLQGATSGFHEGAFATVAMVYTPPIDAPNAVTFMVYDANDQLQDFAQLDAFGDNESVPNNCLTCHSSNSTQDHAALHVSGAHFLPFDPNALDFADVNGFRLEDQQGALRRLNLLVLDTSPSIADTEFVKGLYGGDPTTATAADPTYIPPGWSATPLQQHAYKAAIGPYCRSCHASRTNGAAREAYDFSEADAVIGLGGNLAPLICTDGNDKARRMPDAEVTQRRFWSGTARAYLAALIALPTPCTPSQSQ